MTTSARYTSDEFARRGTDYYARVVQPSLRPEDVDKFVAIDIESGSYEIDRDDYTATERLLARHPQAQIWLERVGRPAAYRIGGHRTSGVLA